MMNEPPPPLPIAIVLIQAVNPGGQPNKLPNVEASGAAAVVGAAALKGLLVHLE
jgi:hypothetical protein